jgi:hypothetical protein
MSATPDGDGAVGAGSWAGGRRDGIGGEPAVGDMVGWNWPSA